MSQCDKPLNFCIQCKFRHGISSTRVLLAFDTCRALPKVETTDPYQGTCLKWRLCHDIRRSANNCIYYKPNLKTRIELFFKGF